MQWAPPVIHTKPHKISQQSWNHNQHRGQVLIFPSNKSIKFQESLHYKKILYISSRSGCTKSFWCGRTCTSLKPRTWRQITRNRARPITIWLESVISWPHKTCCPGRQPPTWPPEIKKRHDCKDPIIQKPSSHKCYRHNLHLNWLQLYRADIHAWGKGMHDSSVTSTSVCPRPSHRSSRRSQSPALVLIYEGNVVPYPDYEIHC